jgi:hypothetical protein
MYNPLTFFAVPGIIRIENKRQNDTELPLLMGFSFINHTETFEKLEERFVQV